MSMEKNRTIPAAGEFYRHFKGNLYQVVGIAKHSETMEQMIVYQALYGDYGLYTRPLDMFLSPVDKVKYPEVLQEYRFEKCVPGENSPEPVLVAETSAKEINTAPTLLQENHVEDSTSEETVREEILRFLDAEGSEAKLKVLRELRMDLDASLMTTIELSLDLLPDEKESLERQIGRAHV